jgi:hypothetical protein
MNDDFLQSTTTAALVDSRIDRSAGCSAGPGRHGQEFGKGRLHGLPRSVIGLEIVSGRCPVCKAVVNTGITGNFPRGVAPVQRGFQQGLIAVGIIITATQAVVKTSQSCEDLVQKKTVAIRVSFPFIKTVLTLACTVQWQRWDRAPRPVRRGRTRPP